MNEIYNMDCAIGLKSIGTETIDLTVTSPPYDDLRSYNGNYTFDFENIAKELFRVTKVGGVLVWIVNDATKNGSETGTSFKQALYFRDLGFNLHDTMIWQKDCFQFPDKTRYPSCFEYMFVLSKGKPKSVHKITDRRNKWYGSMVHGTSRNCDGTTFRKSNDKKTQIKEFGERWNVWNVSAEKHNTTNHPAVFPIRLAKDHIISWSNENDIVLDPFLGSGTTALACIETNRNFVGFEINKEYFGIAQTRISESLKQKANEQLTLQF